MTTMRHRGFALVALLLLGTGAAAAQGAQDAQGLAGLLPPPPKPAAALQLPAAPKPEALLRVPMSADDEMRFFIDAASVRRIDSHQLRYTLVARSRQGADNVDYETFDCARGAWKVEALWQGGRWVEQHGSEWLMVDPGLAGVHGALYNGYLCADNAVDGDAAAVVARLRRGMRPTPSMR